MNRLKNIWVAPGYRALTLECEDSDGKRVDVHIEPADMQRLISACADAVGQIGTEPPIDWDRHPTQIYWPSVTPWKRGERKTKALAE